MQVQVPLVLVQHPTVPLLGVIMVRSVVHLAVWLLHRMLDLQLEPLMARLLAVDTTGVVLPVLVQACNMEYVFSAMFSMIYLHPCTSPMHCLCRQTPMVARRRATDTGDLLALLVVVVVAAALTRYDLEYIVLLCVSLFLFVERLFCHVS